MFTIRNLSVLCYAQGFTMWHYKMPTGTPLGDALRPGYFDGAERMLAVGDVIYIGDATGAVTQRAVRTTSATVRLETLS